jgi:hypothetical protein
MALIQDRVIRKRLKLADTRLSPDPQLPLLSWHVDQLTHVNSNSYRGQSPATFDSS